MIKQNNSFGLRTLLILSICFFTASVANASAVSAKNYQLLTKELSQRVQADLANDSATVKLNNVKEYRVSRSEIGLTGDAICITGENQMPFQFDAKINTPQRKVSEINYNFVDDAANYSPASTEDVLMKELMAQISRDYKTTNILIAIDNFQEVGADENGKKIVGIGEVRIGDLVWNDIKFDVSLDANTKKPKKIVYKVEK